MHALLLLPVFLTLFYGVLLFGEAFNIKSPKGILGMLMLITSIPFVALYFYFLNQYHIYVYFGPFFTSTILLFYPLLFKYLKALSSNQVKMEWLHYTPAALVVAAGLPLWALMDKTEAVFFVEKYLNGEHADHLIMSKLYHLSRIARVIIIVQIVIYISLLHVTIKQLQYRLNDFFSNLNGNELRWFKCLLLMLPVFIFVCILFAIYPNQLYFEHSYFIPLLYTIVSFYLFFLGWFGIRQQEWHLPIDEKPNKNFELNYIRQEIGEKIQDYFSNHSPYLNSTFKITDLCQAIGSNRTYISNYINETYDLNFCQFVNTFRIKEAKNKLSNSAFDSLNLESIAEECGFSSLQTFIRVFNEQCNVSPGKYRKNYRESS
jgi:AraC-like DNA-binding protein